MRHTLCALVGVVLIACCSQNAAAAEAGSSWWPFGKKDEAKVAQPPAVTPPAVGAPSVAAPVGSPFVAPHTAAAPITAAPVPAAPAPAATADAAAEKHWMLSTPKTKVGWPKLSMPGSAAKKKAEAEAPRNAWVDKTPITPKPSPMKPITDGAHKISKGTKDAWHKTVDALTPGEPTNTHEAPRIAKREIKPPFYKRMFGAKSELQGPQTVPEWMAQQRLDP